MDNNKVVTKVSDNIYTVFSEPGDATRYEYLIYRDGPDWFTVAPTRSCFLYPQRLEYWDVKNYSPEGTSYATRRDNPEIDQDAVDTMAKRYRCNPCTVLEVARTIIEIKEGLHG